ncbi:hypothetical protein ACLBWZ_17320 [Brucellaceae bacterium C25G]
MSATQDDCLMIDMEYTGIMGRGRSVYAYRSSNAYSPLTLLITQWLSERSHEVLPYVTPELELEPKITIIPSVTLWERMTETEASQVEAVMAEQPFRTRQIFMTTQTFRSDHELWPLLETMALELFGEGWAKQILS